jgi:hypothetical protein
VFLQPAFSSPAFSGWNRPCLPSFNRTYRTAAIRRATSSSDNPTPRHPIVSPMRWCPRTTSTDDTVRTFTSRRRMRLPKQLDRPMQRRSLPGRILWHISSEVIGSHPEGHGSRNDGIAFGATASSGRKGHIIAYARRAGRLSPPRHRPWKSTASSLSMNVGSANLRHHTLEA